jgi:hypothetical protein
MTRKSKASQASAPRAEDIPDKVLDGEIITEGFAGMQYTEVIEILVENINRVFVANDCTLTDAKVAVDVFKDQLLQMTMMSEGPRAAQELAFRFVQGCLPYIFNKELDDDPRSTFASILEQVRGQLEAHGEDDGTTR